MHYSGWLTATAIDLRLARVDRQRLALHFPPLEEVEAEIRQQIALEDAQDQIRTLHDNIEDAVAGGARVSEVAERFSLPTRSVEAVDENGVTPDDATLDPPLADEVLATANA